MLAHSDALAPTAALEAIVGLVTDIRKVAYFNTSETYENQLLLLIYSQPRALQPTTQLHGADIIDNHIVPYTVNKFDNYCGNGTFVNRTTAVPQLCLTEPKPSNTYFSSTVIPLRQDLPSDTSFFWLRA
jgi:hypothetical protein